MASPFSYKNDSDEDQRASPEENAKRIHEQEQQGGYDKDFESLTNPEHLAKDGKSGDLGDGVRDAEEKGNWTYNQPSSSGGSQKRKRLTVANVRAVVKKRGAIVALLAVLGVGGGALGGILGPSSMIVSLMENLTTTNDSSSTSMQRRFMKVLGFSTTGDPSGLCASSTSIKCKMGRISNSALNKLSKKGIVPYNSSGPIDLKKGFGYPKQNPTGYSIDMKDGSIPKNIAAKDLPGFLTNNPKVAARVLGTGGAFNLKMKAWTGKYITNKLFDKFGLKRDGGLADGEAKSSKYEEVLAKFREKIPGLNKLSDIKANVELKVNSHLGAAKKGGTGYTIAVAGCIATKAPSYIAAGAAAVQVAEILPTIVDVVLSPAGKLKASGVDPDVKFTANDASGVGDLLTTKTARASDGKMTAPLDSPYLQSALGINKNKVPVSKDYTPGFSVLTSPIVIAANKVEKKTATECNAIMSPAAMYTAMSVDAAATVIASGTVIGGIIKVAAGWAISEIAVQVVSSVAGDLAVGVVKDLATNDKVASAQGEALGDVLGISASAFFASGGMARDLPGLKVSQVPEFAALQKEDQDDQRAMDVASLSPLDTSSRYTFMGSIVYNMRLATLTGGGYSNGILSMLSDAVKLPFGLSDSASALGYSDASCGYAADFGLDTTDPEDTPAINMAGLPCTGLTTGEASMSTQTAIDLIENEGWLDETKSINDDSTIDDLLQNGYIKSDTPLSDYISTCSDASTGDYLFNAASCTTDTVKGDVTTVKSSISSSDVGAGTDGLKDGNAMAAIPVFLLDYQSMLMVNGEDDADTSTSSDTTTTTGSDTDSDEAGSTEDASAPTSSTPITDSNSVAFVPTTLNTAIYDPLAAFSTVPTVIATRRYAA